MTQVRKDFQGRGKVETFSRSRIQAMGDGVQLALGIARQVRALGKYWRSRPLVFSLVPRCHGVYGSAKKIRIASR